MRKTLAKGGRGDKMAAALMNHIEKERKKLSVASSSLLMPRSTRRTTGDYGVHWPSPAGPSTHFNVEGCLGQWSPTTGPRAGTGLAESLRADAPASLRPSAVGGAAVHSTLTKILVC